MKTYKQVNQTIADKVFCDRCHNEVVYFYINPWQGHTSVLHNIYGRKISSVFGEIETDWEFEVVDVCENCLLELKELLEENGFISMG